MSSPPEATGVVLAGGRSARFGRDKTVEPFRGVPMLHHAARRLAEVCGEVVVVLSRDGPEPPLPGDVTVRIARDSVEGLGPLAGALAGLRGVGTELALLAGGDMPLLEPRVLMEMLHEGGRTRAGAVALQDGDAYRPLPCVIAVAEARESGQALLDGGSRRLRDLLDELHVTVLEESRWLPLDPERRTLFDVDEPADLET